MLTIDNISFEFGGRFLFKEATLQIMPGDKIGLIGRNGTGKTTLLKVIAGEYTPTLGKVAMARSTKLGYLHQELLGVTSEKDVFGVAIEAFAPVIKLRDEIDEILLAMDQGVTEESLIKLQDKQGEFESADGYNIEFKTHSILAGLGFSEEQQKAPYLSLSGGWRMRVMLAKILLQEPDVLLLDEPTNHLDLPSIEWLEDYLQAFKGAYIVVSHDRHFLDKLISTTVEIGNQKFNIYKGNYSFYLTERVVRKEIQERQFDNQQREIEQTEKFINRFRAKASKAKQVQSRVKSLERMDVVEAPENDAASVHFKFKPSVNPGKTILEVKIREKGYGSKKIILNSSGQILRGDKIALVGANGIGKSTILRIAAGQEPFQGERKEGHNVMPAFFAQHTADVLNPRNNIMEEMSDFVYKKSETIVRNILGGFLFSGEDVEKKISVLSGGEKSRVALAKTLMADSNFLLLDEPTNHLDIQSIQILIQALQDYEGTFIVVSHDRYFLEMVANKIWFIKDQHLGEYPGTYTEYHWHELEKTKQKTEELKKPSTKKVVAEIPKEVKTKSFEEDREIKRKKRKLESDLEKTEEEIRFLEAEKSMQEATMLNPDMVSNYAKMGQIQARITEIDLAILEKMAKWEKLSQQVAQAD